MADKKKKKKEKERPEVTVWPLEKSLAQERSERGEYFWTRHSMRAGHDQEYEREIARRTPAMRKRRLGEGL